MVAGDVRRRVPSRCSLLAAACSLLVSMPGALAQLSIEPLPDVLRMNQIQVVGTHNSYHVRPSDAALSLYTKITGEARAWDYSHAPLDVQLDRGVRSFELDLHNQTDGYGVFHAPYVDYGSTCERFIQCLEVVKTWSDTHPAHVPISFLLEIKDEGYLLDPQNIAPPDADALDRLDAELRSIFSEDRLVTPDLVRGDAATLETAVRERGWPDLEDVRGRVMFILHERGETRRLYTEGRPSLEGRAMFVRSDEGRTDAAVLIVDGPDIAEIQRLVANGFFVRTRADSGLHVRGTERRDAALASGAQIISTDFPPGEAHPESGYDVTVAIGAAARVNPVNALHKYGEPVTE